MVPERATGRETYGTRERTHNFLSVNTTVYFFGQYEAARMLLLVQMTGTQG